MRCRFDLSVTFVSGNINSRPRVRFFPSSFMVPFRFSPLLPPVSSPFFPSWQTRRLPGPPEVNGELLANWLSLGVSGSCNFFVLLPSVLLYGRKPTRTTHQRKRPKSDVGNFLGYIFCISLELERGREKLYFISYFSISFSAFLFFRLFKCLMNNAKSDRARLLIYEHCESYCRWR